ncbi:MAG: class I SAM-dependent methyltransferase [Oscillochloridaceae bacterium umkhey_bin13]
MEQFVYHQDFKHGLFSKYLEVAARLPAAGTILEIGCHTGYFSAYLQRQGYTVFGIEYNAAAVAEAVAQGVDAIQGDIEDATLIKRLGRTFDVIVIMDVLEHLRDPASVLRSLAVLLNPGGKVLITGPNITYWAVRKDLLLGRWRHTETGILDRTHLHLYSAADWHDLCQAARYNVRDFGVAEGFLPLEHVMRRMPLLQTLVPVLRDIAKRLTPDLFATVYLIEAVPEFTA